MTAMPLLGWRCDLRGLAMESTYHDRHVAARCEIISCCGLWGPAVHHRMGPHSSPCGPPRYQQPPNLIGSLWLPSINVKMFICYDQIVGRIPKLTEGTCLFLLEEFVCSNMLFSWHGLSLLLVGLLALIVTAEYHDLGNTHIYVAGGFKHVFISPRIWDGWLVDSYGLKPPTRCTYHIAIPQKNWWTHWTRTSERRPFLDFWRILIDVQHQRRVGLVNDDRGAWSRWMICWLLSSRIAVIC